MTDPLADLRRFLNNIATAKGRGVCFPPTRQDGSTNAPYVVGDKYCIQVVECILGEKHPAQTVILLLEDAVRVLEVLEKHHDIRYERAKPVQQRVELTQHQLVYFLQSHNLRVDYAPKVVEQQKGSNDASPQQQAGVEASESVKRPHDD